MSRSFPVLIISFVGIVKYDEIATSSHSMQQFMRLQMSFSEIIFPEIKNLLIWMNLIHNDFAIPSISLNLENHVTQKNLRLI